MSQNKFISKPIDNKLAAEYQENYEEEEFEIEENIEDESRHSQVHSPKQNNGNRLDPK